MTEKTINVGELVTVDLGEFLSASNTYLVVSKFESVKGIEYCVLSHPLAPKCHIVKDSTELNTVMAQLKDPTEHCLDFAKKYSKYIGYKLQAELDALCLYFVIYKNLATNQKDRLALINSKIAAVIVRDDLKKAADLVKQNVALLDTFNQACYNSFKGSFEDISQANTKVKRQMIFRIAGYIMAQIEQEA